VLTPGHACAGLRQVRPGGKFFPSWFDIFPNSDRIKEVEAPVCVLHVSTPHILPSQILSKGHMWVGASIRHADDWLQ
jgi:hypothetical protein